VAVQHVSAFTGTHESRQQLFNLNAIQPLLRLMGDIPAIAQYVFTSLTNLAEEHNICLSMIETNKVVVKVVDCVVEGSEGRNNQLIDLHASLLSNVTLLPEGIAQLDSINPIKVHKLVNILLQYYIESPERHPSIGMALVNIAQLNSARTSLLSPGTSARDLALSKLFTLLTYEHVAVRRVAIGVIHNCCFESDHHPTLLEAGLIEHMLSPLRGPFSLSDEDKVGLPLTLHAPRTLEDDHRCKVLILETFNMLMYHRQSRTALRANKMYPILRELDKVEEDEELKEAICNLVQYLVNEEEGESAVTTENGNNTQHAFV